MDDQRTDREGEPSVAWEIVGPIIITACICSLIGLVNGLNPQSPKGAPLYHVEPITAIGIAIDIGVGALAGAMLGAVATVILALLRILKK
jgi:hypothetical protein